MKNVLPLLTFALLFSCQTKEKVVAEPDSEKVTTTEGTSAQVPPPEVTTPAAMDLTKPDSLVGLPLADVEAACKAAEVRCRVVEIDGKPLPITMDYSESRLNFTVEGGKITAVTKG